MENTLNENVVWGMPVVQNQQDFVIGVFSIKQILQFTKYTKRLIVGYDEENKPVYNKEIQREVENSRVEKIADFLVEDQEATFPTNIVLHVPSQVIVEQKRNNNFLEMRLEKRVFEGVTKAQTNEEEGDVLITIIDGQHRIRGIEVAIERLKSNMKSAQQTMIGSSNNQSLSDKFNFYKRRLDDLLNIQLVVSFFVDKSLEYQAMIFSTINRTQKRVSESLVYDLFGITTNDSPQKTSLQIVLALNAHHKSPFFNRVNLYGESYQANQSPPLSQAAMVKSILGLISEDLGREAENDRRKQRKDLLLRSPGSLKPLPFRVYYARNADTTISNILFQYYSAVRDTFLKEDSSSFWSFNPERMRPTNVLHTTVGYQALLKLLVDILGRVNEEQKTNKNTYIEYLSKVKHLNWADITRYPFTSRTANVLHLDMSLLVWPYPIDDKDKRPLKLKELLEKND